MAATTDRRLDAPAEGPGPDDIEPVLHETRDRIITGTVTVVPFLLLALVAWQLWNNLLHWHDLVVFAILYAASGLGITVGFHRLFTHRSFKTSPALRGVFAILGSIAIEGPVISWVADHRKHHAFSDQPGDPHSPHVDHGGGWRGALRGLAARARRLAVHPHPARQPPRYAPDLIADPVVSFVDRTFVFWAIGGIARAFGLGWLIGGTLTSGAHRPAVGRRGAPARPAPRRPSHQLAVPLLRAPAGSPPATSRATSRGSRRSRSARRGTTTTTRSRPRPRTASAAARSTSRPG